VAATDQTALSTARDRRVGAYGARTRLWARAALLLTAVLKAEIGTWGLIAPHSFFTTYPGLGHHWVSGLGRYNEHLLRDYAAAELGFAVLLAAAAIWFERRLVLVACAAFLAATLPHLAYHLTTTGDLSAADNLASLGGFVIELVLVLGATLIAWRSPP
jgi:hypothetical protein